MDGVEKAREAAGEALSKRAFEGAAGNTWDDTKIVLDAFLAELQKTHVIVPREPTQAMLNAGADEDDYSEEGTTVGQSVAANVWSAMLAASQKESVSSSPSGGAV